MERITVTSKLDSSGVLNLVLPMNPANADQAVQVTVEPVSTAKLSQEQWKQLILSLAGKWQGEFERPEQGEFERREPLS